jgi:sec-independent protein translocase protein TatB
VFDVGLWELLLIAVLCLIVVGPKRLPRLARTAGVLVGRAKLMVAQVKAEVDREIDAEDLRNELDKSRRDITRGLGGDEDGH